jgi:uncharacterized protein YbjT (DUF2867 family)
VARCLIVGCGCRGRSLAAELSARGHLVRGTTRDPAALGAIEAAGAEAIVADPDRMATLVPALDHVSVVVLLLGTAAGEPGRVAELHGSRLEMLLHKLLDTTVRGLVYEAAGTVRAEVLAAGAALVSGACETSRIPYALITTDPGAGEWLTEGLGAVERVLAAAG